jgi:hypothetical protein
MVWYYAVNGQQSGPVSEAELDELLRSKTINGNTLVWREGLAQWEPLRTARPTGPAVLADGKPGTVCVECQQAFPQSNMVFINQSWVCAGCKPIFIQRVMEGAPPPALDGATWRMNRRMIMRSETPLPDRCVRCNAPANGYRLKRKLYWHPPGYYLLIFVGLLIYLIIALCVRKKALVHVGLCEKHRAQRKWIIAGSWLAVLLGFVMMIGGLSEDSGAVSLSGVVLLLVGVVFGILKGPVVSVVKIDNEFVWLKGPGEDYLAQMPEWSGPR